MRILLGHRRGVRGGQCQDRVAQRFPVGVPCTGDQPVWLRHNLTAPGSQPAQTVWRYGERYKPDTLDPRLGMQPLPDEFSGVRVIDIFGDNRPAALVTAAHGRVPWGNTAMLLQGRGPHRKW